VHDNRLRPLGQPAKEGQRTAVVDGAPGPLCDRGEREEGRTVDVVGVVGARGAEKNRVEKLLEDACIKVSVVASDIFGVSGRARMAAMIAGQRDPKVLAQMARSRTRAKISQLEEAFTGHFDDHHRFLLVRMPGRIDTIDADIAGVGVRTKDGAVQEVLDFDLTRERVSGTR